MRTLRLRFRPLSTWSTPWRADSLFGAICWALADRAGEEALRRVLDRFRRGEPPFVLSDACPGDLLPRPLAAVPAPAEEARERAWRRSRWLTPTGFAAARAGAPVPAIEARAAPFRSRAVPHAAIDRRTGTTSGTAGAFFESEEWALAREPADGGDAPDHLSLYVRAIDPTFEDALREALRAVGLGGFGKHRSAGKGAFEIDGAFEPRPDLDPQPGDDGYVLLSHLVPAPDDPTDGVWRTHVSYPKLARGPIPWKRPVLTVAPGSCFRAGDRPVRPWLGSALGGVAAANPEAIHYAFGFAVGFRWPQGSAGSSA